MIPISFIGRPTKDIVVQTSDRGVKYAQFTVATKSGGSLKEQKDQFFDCVLFNEDAERIVKAGVRKGSLIHVSGLFNTQEYEKEGVKYRSFKVTDLKWSFVPGSSSKKGADESKAPPAEAPAESPDTGTSYVEVNLDDDSLPF